MTLPFMHTIKLLFENKHFDIFFRAIVFGEHAKMVLSDLGSKEG